MNSISAVVIAKNEEKMIADCLSSLSFCDEIILVDNSSTDKTPEIGKKMGAKVIECSTNDFSELRNVGLSKANLNWILYVDADERLTPELVSSIKHQISSVKNSLLSAFKIRRKNFYFGSHEWPYIERLERLFKKDSLKKWHGQLHESPIVKGEIGELDGFLLHYTHRGLTSMLKKTLEWSKIEAELRFKSDHPKMSWWRFPRVMISAFCNSFFNQGGWRVGAIGLIESIYQSFSMFITYARLWEMQEKRKKINSIN